LVQSAFFFSILIAASLAFFAMLAPFFEPILWAVTLAILFKPVQKKLTLVLPERENLAALGTLLIIVFAVIVPALLLSVSVGREGIGLYKSISSGEIDLSGPLSWAQNTWPSLVDRAESLGISLEEAKQKLSSSALQGSQWAASHIFTFGQNTLRFAVMFFLMLYLLFFFLRDGKKIIDKVIHILPIGDERERYLLSKFAEVSRATIKGTLVVGAIQGTIGGFIFYLLGIESAVFWGVVMILLSILPAIGSALVWIPAAIYLITSGMLIKGIILILVGFFVIGMIDNILRPILVGRDTKMPDYLILLSTLGGIAMIGISGFVLGPVIAAFFLTIWAMFAKDYNLEDIT
jgi:predicted PurR-regulated permease PerM|tara:strand:+ start:41825 stop:42868 length:1044 start_codon:yes stop_codon:yes gene_type:complete